MAAAAAASSTHQISIPDSQYQMPLPDWQIDRLTDWQTSITLPDRHPDSTITPPVQSCFKFSVRRTSSHFISTSFQKKKLLFWKHTHTSTPAYHLSSLMDGNGKVPSRLMPSCIRWTQRRQQSPSTSTSIYWSVEHLDSPTTVIRRSQAARTDHPIPAQSPSARVDRTNIPADTHLMSDKTHISDNGDCYLTAKTIYIRFPHCYIPNILIEMLQKTSDFIKTLLFLYIGKNDKKPLFWIFAISVKNIGFHKNAYL
jgi:hypothetical protein